MVCGVLCFYGYKVILGGNCENFIFNNGIFFFCFSFWVNNMWLFVFLNKKL